jgi:hypothetical protein
MTKGEAKTGKKKQSAKLPAVDLAVAAAESKQPSISWCWTCEDRGLHRLLRDRVGHQFAAGAGDCRRGRNRARKAQARVCVGRPVGLDSPDYFDFIMHVFGSERRVFTTISNGCGGNADRIEMT